MSAWQTVKVDPDKVEQQIEARKHAAELVQFVQDEIEKFPSHCQDILREAMQKKFCTTATGGKGWAGQ